MRSLKDVEFYECMKVTDSGVKFLADLPNLRQFGVTGMPHVTFDGTQVFPSRVGVTYWTESSRLLVVNLRDGHGPAGSILNVQRQKKWCDADGHTE